MDKAPGDGRSAPAPGSRFRVRRAGVDDAALFTAQRMALFREEGSAPAGAAGADLACVTRAAFEHSLERGTIEAWLAVEEGGTTLGSCALAFVERLPSPRNPVPLEGYLAHLYVVPERRRAGVGSALVRAAMAAASARGLVRLRLHATEAGRALYAQLGFRLRANDMEIELPGPPRT